MENLTFGIEIEYRDLAKDFVTIFVEANFSDWKSIKEDAIIKSTNNSLIGGEIVSPILHDNELTWKIIKKICQFLIDNNASCLNTGAHIHIGANIFENNSKYLLRFIKFWCAYEHIIYRFSYGEYIYARDTLFSYSPPVNKELKFLINTLKLTYQDDFNYLINVLNLGKKRGLNLSNINKNTNKNTVEFRCPNGTFNAFILHNNFMFFKRLLEYAKSSNFDEELIDEKLKLEHDIESNKIELNDAMELASLIFATEKEKLRFLKQYIKGNEETKEYILSRC